MKYSLSWSDRAKRELSKLPPSMGRRIYDKVESIADDPYRTVERCEGYPYYHQRIGAYRAILKIDDSAMLITVVKVGPRKKVYDR
ncbi:MAG: type II toxin-antitoxin system RelE/ParE family toxin [Methanoregula sp.]